MTSDRTRRVKRCYWWGFGAVLAAAAGAAAQQSDSSTKTYQPGQTQNQSSVNQQGWQSADYIPQLSNGTVVLCKEENNKTTQVTIQDGRVSSAEVDGQYVPAERVQVQGNKLRVLDENNQVAATLKIPRISGLAQGGMSRQYGTSDRYSDNRFNDSRFNDNRSGYNTDRYSTNTDRYGNSDRYNDRYSDQQNQYQPDRYGRDYSQDQNRSDDWRLRDQDRSYNRDYPRDQDRYSRQDYYRQDYNRDNAYQPDRYDSRYDNRQGTYDNRYNSNYNRQGSQPMRSGRVYGTTESGRPALGLGIMTSEAATTDLNTTSTGTKYTQGIKVEQLQDGMPAASSGLQKGDIIVAIDGRTPATITVLQQRVAEKDAGDTLQLRVLRNGTEQTIPVKLEKIDYSKYNWDYMGNATTVDQGRDTVDQELLQPNNKQEIYRPSEDGSGNAGRPAWDRMRDQITKPR